MATSDSRRDLLHTDSAPSFPNKLLRVGRIISIVGAIVRYDIRQLRMSFFPRGIAALHCARRH